MSDAPRNSAEIVRAAINDAQLRLDDVAARFEDTERAHETERVFLESEARGRAEAFGEAKRETVAVRAQLADERHRVAGLRRQHEAMTKEWNEARARVTHLERSLRALQHLIENGAPYYDLNLDVERALAGKKLEDLPPGFEDAA